MTDLDNTKNEYTLYDSNAPTASYSETLRPPTTHHL